MQDAVFAVVRVDAAGVGYAMECVMVSSYKSMVGVMVLMMMTTTIETEMIANSAEMRVDSAFGGRMIGSTDEPWC